MIGGRRMNNKLIRATCIDHNRIGGWNNCHVKFRLIGHDAVSLSLKKFPQLWIVAYVRCL